MGVVSTLYQRSFGNSRLLHKSGCGLPASLSQLDDVSVNDNKVHEKLWLKRRKEWVWHAFGDAYLIAVVWAFSCRAFFSGHKAWRTR